KNSKQLLRTLECFSLSANGVNGRKPVARDSHHSGAARKGVLVVGAFPFPRLLFPLVAQYAPVKNRLGTFPADTRCGFFLLPVRSAFHSRRFCKDGYRSRRSETDQGQ
ncbi:MAG: hypothetical protein LBO79_09525, partial [Zoogloeaceae bacterium]|nr:hypothetical protein [Zoogloeaceae bacterium]